MLKYVPSIATLVRVIYHERMWNFIKCFSWDYWDECVCFFVFPFVIVVYHTDWFAYIKPSLPPWNESNLIMVYEPFMFFFFFNCASLVAQTLKCLPAMQETWVRSLGWEDPLEKEMATYSSIPAWRIPWMEEPGGLQSTGSQRVRHDWVTSLSLSPEISFWAPKSLQMVTAAMKLKDSYSLEEKLWPT